MKVEVNAVSRTTLKDLSVGDVFEAKDFASYFLLISKSNGDNFSYEVFDLEENEKFSMHKSVEVLKCESKIIIGNC